MVSRSPVNLRKFARITLEAGTAVPAELANNSDITAQVQDVTYPEIAVAELNAGGAKADYPITGKLQPMNLVMIMTSIHAGLLAGVGKEYSFEYEETLVTPRSTTRPMLTMDVTGILLRTNFNNLNLANDEIRPVTYNYRLLAYKLVKGDVAEPIYDIDIPAGIYRQNGEDMFPE